MWYIYTVEYHSTTKKNKIMPLAAIKLEIVILSEVKPGREKQISHDITYMWKVNGRNKPIYKIEVESQIQKTNLWFPGGGINWDIGTDIYKIGRTDTEAPILWSSAVKSRLIGKDPDAGKD